MSKVPNDDVLTEILIRVPAKRLLVMRFVCKSWYKIITHPSFIKAHLQKTIDNKHDHRSKEKEQQVFEYRDPPFPIISNFIFVGTCHGILCCWVCGRFLLWNPVTGQSEFIAYSSKGITVVMTAFGYDSKTDDYKIMMMTRPKTSFEYNTTYGIEVYSMKKNWRHKCSIASSWRPLDDENKVALSNGSLVHWLVHYPPTGIVKIICFDMVNEDVKEISLSNSMIPIDCKYFAKLDGCLAVFVQLPKDGGYQLWVMEEHGVVESWTKRGVLPLDTDLWLTDFRKPLVFIPNGKGLRAPNGKRLSVVLPRRNIVSFDQKTKDEMITEFGVHLKSKTCGVDDYVESLISIVL